MTYLIGVIVAILGGYQIYAARGYLNHLKVAANAATSSFALLAVWSSFIIGAILFFGGIALLFGVFGR